MKKSIITIFTLVFSISFCMAQNVQNQKVTQDQNIRLEKQRDEQRIQDELARKRAAEAQQRAMKDQLAREAEQRYQNAIESAQRNFEQGEYAQAKQDYLTAFELKPEKAASYIERMTEVDRLVLEKAKEDAILESERLYETSIASAQRNISQRQYAKAKQDYLTALKLKPENADFINSKIAEMEKPATLNIYRKGSLLEVLSDNYDVLFDNVVIGRTKHRWKISLTVNEMETKTVSAANDGMQAELHIDFEPGRIYYLRCDVNTRYIKTGDWKTRKKRDGTIERYEDTRIEYTPRLELVETKLGEREFNSIK